MAAWLWIGVASASDVATGNFLPGETTLADRGLSFVGIFLLAAVAWLLSEDRRAIRWRPVAWGVGLQLAFGAAVLSPWLSELFFKVVNTAVSRLLDFSNEGAKFVFGSLDQHFFAFSVLPTIIFFSSLMGLLYHLGVMQVLVRWIAKAMVVTLGTSGAESLSAAGNIFVGQTEAPLLIRPFVDKMTRSELMAVMTGGFATVAGGVLGAYVGFLQGIPNIAGHLVVASIISAPAALAVAKIMVPETEHSVTMGKVEVEFQRTASNSIEAAARGAADGLTLALNVAAMLIAIVGLVALADWVISFVPLVWCSDGVRDVGYACVRDAGALGLDLPTVTAALEAGEVVMAGDRIQVVAASAEAGTVTLAGELMSLSRLLGWIFAPVAFVMGVPWAEAAVVGRLLGEKIVLTEFIAYIHLSDLLASEVPQISERSAIIASYALCGFANFASIGIQLGGIGGIAPNKMSVLASLGLRAMTAGVIAACMTGAVAGLFL